MNCKMRNGYCVKLAQALKKPLSRFCYPTCINYAPLCN